MVGWCWGIGVGGVFGVGGGGGGGVGVGVVVGGGGGGGFGDSGLMTGTRSSRLLIGTCRMVLRMVESLACSSSLIHGRLGFVRMPLSNLFSAFAAAVETNVHPKTRSGRLLHLYGRHLQIQFQPSCRKM